MFDVETEARWNDFGVIWVVSSLTFMLWFLVNIAPGVIIGPLQAGCFRIFY